MISMPRTSLTPWSWPGLSVRQMVYREEHVVLPMTQTAAPAAGQYFIRVRATNTSGYTQDAFDYYVIDSGKVYGVKCFYIQPDGTVVEDTYEE